jgi:hypothetical protein
LWVEFEPWRPQGLAPCAVFGVAGALPPRQFGVTGWDADDCWALVCDLFGASEPPPVERVVWDVDVSSLDAHTVLPHVGNPVERGVWFRGPVLVGA